MLDRKLGIMLLQHLCQMLLTSKETAMFDIDSIREIEDILGKQILI